MENTPLKIIIIILSSAPKSPHHSPPLASDQLASRSIIANALVHGCAASVAKATLASTHDVPETRLARTEIRSHRRVPRSGTPRWLASIFTLLLPRVHESRLPRTLPAIFEGGNDANHGEAQRHRR